MGYPPIEELLPKAGNSIYKLVRIAADRAIELADGKKKLVDIPSSEKTTTIALQEIREGMVVLKEVAKQFEPDTKEKLSKKKTKKEKDSEDASEEGEEE